MAKPNYQYEKRQRDMAKKNKQEEKRRQKLNDKAIASDVGSNFAMSASEDTVSNAGVGTSSIPVGEIKPEV